MTQNPTVDPSPTQSQKPLLKARRGYDGPAFLSGAFRPFFLAASVWAGVAVLLWLSAYNDWFPGFANAFHVDWHSHEMIFGFAAAAIGGFILTAIPNWTGRLPVRGWPLAGLAGLWLLGRVVMLSGQPYLMVLDVAFLLVLAGVVAREILAGKNKRNIGVAVLISLLAIANILTHFERLQIGDLSGQGWRMALAIIVLLISVIGGRVTPSFTRNWLAKQAVTHTAQKPKMPAAPGLIDKIAIVLSLIALSGFVFAPTNTYVGIALIVAGIAQGVRVSRWQMFETVKDPIVLILHVGYCWLGLGLLLLGASLLSDDFLVSDAIHGLTIGAIGVMIAAVSSRASLGHAGKKITAGLGLISVYAFINLAAIMRLGAASFERTQMITFSGLLWIAGFGLFAALFTPLYFVPRGR